MKQQSSNVLLLLIIFLLLYQVFQVSTSFFPTGGKDGKFCSDFYNPKVRKSMVDYPYQDVLPFLDSRNITFGSLTGFSFIFGKNKIVFVMEEKITDYYNSENRHSFVFKDFIYYAYGANCLSNLFMPYVIVLCDERTFVFKRSQGVYYRTYYEEAYPELVMLNWQRGLEDTKPWEMWLLQKVPGKTWVYYKRTVDFETTNGKLGLGMTSSELADETSAEKFQYTFISYKYNPQTISFRLKYTAIDPKDSKEFGNLFGGFIKRYSDPGILFEPNNDDYDSTYWYAFYFPSQYQDSDKPVTRPLLEAPANFCWFKDGARDYNQLSDLPDVEPWTKSGTGTWHSETIPEVATIHPPQKVHTYANFGKSFSIFVFVLFVLLICVWLTWVCLYRRRSKQEKLVQTEPSKVKPGKASAKKKPPKSALKKKAKK